MKKTKLVIIAILVATVVLAGYSLVSASEITGGLSNQGVIPVAPSGVSAVKTGTYQITISWNAVAGADGYKIYRKKDAGNFELLPGNVIVLSYVDGSLADGTYSYQVQSFKGTLMPDLVDIQPTAPITIVSPTTPTPTPTPSGGGGGGGAPAATPTPSPTTSLSPTPLPSEAKKADVNNDNKIDVLEFNTLMVNWGSTTGGNVADFNGDGKVDIMDFNFLMIYWSNS